MQAQYRRAVGRRNSVHPFLLRFWILLFIAFIAGCAGVERADVAPTILVSDRLVAYQEVADAIAARLPGVQIHSLEGDARRIAPTLAKLRDEPSAAVIAIGTLATNAALTLRDRTVVYCQDFSREYAAAANHASFRGVSAVPPAYKQLQAWKMIEPDLRRVTLISGEGTDAFGREAVAAARRLGIKLDHANVHSDRELSYVIKRLSADVQGVWFVPDNRILSVPILRETLAYNLKYGRQSLVFNPQLLGFGAMMSIESDPEDVAERVLEQLRPSDGRALAAVPLQRARVRINVEIARQLGVVVPPAMEKGRYVF